MLDQVRNTCRRKHFSPKTEKYYIYWVRQVILYHGKRHPKDIGKQEIESYLNHLVVKRKVSASTQSGALNAIAFLYREILKKELPLHYT